MKSDSSTHPSLIHNLPSLSSSSLRELHHLNPAVVPALVVKREVSGDFYGFGLQGIPKKGHVLSTPLGLRLHLL